MTDFATYIVIVDRLETGHRALCLIAEELGWRRESAAGRWRHPCTLDSIKVITRLSVSRGGLDGVPADAPIFVHISCFHSHDKGAVLDFQDIMGYRYSNKQNFAELQQQLELDSMCYTLPEPEPQPEPQPHEGDKTMHDSRKVFLIEESVRCVAATYERPEFKPSSYHFKTFDSSLDIGDYVVVPTDGDTKRHQLTVVRITEVDLEPDLESNIELKWIIGKVDSSAHEQTVEQEKAFIEKSRAAVRRRKRKQLKEDLFEDMEESDLKLIPVQKTEASPTPKKVCIPDEDYDDEIPF